jgi:ribonucleoside-diphosphate reductase alpha chain
MGQKGKFLVTKEGRFDLGTHMWDDQVFTDILIRDNPIDSEKAMGISLRTELQTITMPFIEKMIEAKLMEYGFTKVSPIRLDQSIFVKNQVNLSDNARRVLRRRYLKKDSHGKLVETPEKMFRRVARHIAKAEKTYGGDWRPVLFCRLKTVWRAYSVP